VNTFVIDAGIAVKWVVDEDGTPEALTLRQRAKLIAPELLVAECANILWKKVQRDELLKQEALLAARLLQGAEIELLPMRSLFETATRMSIEINHPAYDCVYLALANNSKCQFVAADERFLRKLRQGRHRTFRGRAISLIEAVQLSRAGQWRYFDD
jgi:predicted nucleic acid-binding protein